MIGIFDSGIGGLTVLREIEKQLPHCGYIYLADSAFTPYGEKSQKTIIERSIKLVEELIKQGATIIVVACNSATAIAVDSLRQKYSLPIVAMEPAVKTAVNHSDQKKVGILATKMTLSSERYAKLLERFVDSEEVYEEACNGLVEQIEKRKLNEKETKDLLNKYIKPLLDNKVDTIVLGCTHYPLLQKQIQEIAGNKVRLIDTAIPVTCELIKQIEIHNLQDCTGERKFFTTGSLEEYQKQLQFYWQRNVKSKKLKID